ncbi:CDP-alcohol phosphatidyltransferase family protein [Bergeyella sp. RCAD1439]|uniref:CDP-alcohol phosphatidyltransferase family protein n=1 Tax=Bergeyella anatis TaxID=3113737 RepID=UPI002E18A1EF|nr:CDP-alcohol phosphatidyltransferase family protein [Bergeyella sp. RCAD1439]
MTFLKNNLANLLTLGNLFSGSIGVIHLIQGDYRTTAFCIVLSLLLDFLDGFVARALKANSNLGVQLDSLADMVSFGLLPGVTLYQLLAPFGNEFLGASLSFRLQYLGLLVTAFSCLRLAIFNLDEDQKYYFKGLNTPSNTILIFGLYYFLMENALDWHTEAYRYALVLLTIVSAWLLVSPIRMISMKFKSKALKDNLSKIALVLGGLLILALFSLAGIPLVIVYYILISLVFRHELR